MFLFHEAGQKDLQAAGGELVILPIFSLQRELFYLFVALERSNSCSVPLPSPGNTRNFKFHNHGAVSIPAGVLEVAFTWKVSTATPTIKTK